MLRVSAGPWPAGVLRRGDAQCRAQRDEVSHRRCGAHRAPSVAAPVFAAYIDRRRVPFPSSWGGDTVADRYCRGDVSRLGPPHRRVSRATPERQGISNRTRARTRADDSWEVKTTLGYDAGSRPRELESQRSTFWQLECVNVRFLFVRP